MFHLAAYRGNGGDDAEVDVAAVPDDIVTIQNSHYVLSSPLQLVAALAMGANLARARLASPSMRQISPPYIRPIEVGLTIPNNPNMWILDYNPFIIRPFEEVQFLAANRATFTTEVWGLAWLADAIVPLPSGNIIPWRWTTTTAAVDSVWTTLSVTFADTLPSGTYAAVFSEHVTPSPVAHRWIFPNQTWRPGFPSVVDPSSRLPYAVSKGQFGVMGRFRSNDLPRPQVLCSAADVGADMEGYLHVIRIGDVGIPFAPF